MEEYCGSGTKYKNVESWQRMHRGIVEMRIRTVYPAKNYILYVTFNNNKILKFDMSDIIENDSDFLELKKHPEIFVDVRLVNKKRSIGWRDNITLSGDIVEKNGTPVNLGYLEVYSNEFEELQRHYTEPIVKKALKNRYGSFIYFEEGEFKEFAEWLYGCYISNLDKDDNSADIAFLYKNMQDRMTWVRESEKNWIVGGKMILPPRGCGIFCSVSTISLCRASYLSCPRVPFSSCCFA